MLKYIFYAILIAAALGAIVWLDKVIPDWVAGVAMIVIGAIVIIPAIYERIYNKRIHKNGGF